MLGGYRSLLWTDQSAGDCGNPPFSLAVIGGRTPSDRAGMQDAGAQRDGALAPSAVVTGGRTLSDSTGVHQGTAAARDHAHHECHSAHRSGTASTDRAQEPTSGGGTRSVDRNRARTKPLPPILS